MATSKHHPRKLRTIVIDRHVIEQPNPLPVFIAGVLMGAMTAVAVLSGVAYERPALKPPHVVYVTRQAETKYEYIPIRQLVTLYEPLPVIDDAPVKHDDCYRTHIITNSTGPLMKVCAP